jgi:hypothetical protein
MILKRVWHPTHPSLFAKTCSQKKSGKRKCRVRKSDSDSPEREDIFTPDRTKNIDHKRRSTAHRVQRWRERRKAKRLEAEKAAKIARRADLDAARVARGLAPAKTSTQRATESRARQAEALEIVRTESWHSPSFRDWHDAKAYLTGLKPEVPEKVIENVLESTRREVPRWALNWNRFVVTNGIAQARLRRAILWQILDVLYQQDITYLREAMEQAETRTDIAFEEGSHPTVKFQERQRVYDMSQIMLREGGSLNSVD